MAKKIDLSKVKEFLLKFGDKVALGLCASSALLLVGMGLLSANSARGKHWAEEFQTAADKIKRAVQTAPPYTHDPKDVESVEKKQDWLIYHSQFQAGPLFTSNEMADNKRRTPIVLPVNNSPGSIQLDYLRAGSESYNVDFKMNNVEAVKEAAPAGKPEAKNTPAAAPKLIRIHDPTRMVVVSAVFPMANQVEEFRKYLKMRNQQELFKDPDDLPHPIALNVRRFEMRGDKAIDSGVLLYQFNPETERTKVTDEIATVLAKAVYNESLLPGLKKYIHAGMTTPIPHFRNTTYPKLDLKGIVQEGEDMVEENKIMPKKPLAEEKKGAKEPVATIMFPFSKLPKDALLEKFLKRSEVFHVLGLPLDGGKGSPYTSAFDLGLENANKIAAGPNDVIPAPGGGPNRMKKPPLPEAPNNAGMDPNASWAHDALVRFFDVDVEPGRTYCYEIEVWMRNPNFGKETLVAFTDLAKIKILKSPSIKTPSISIPEEYYFYASDPAPLNAQGKPIFEKKDEAKPDQTAVQVHRWFDWDQKFNKSNEIADWAVAERNLVRRGEWISGRGVITKVPTWNKYTQEFEIQTQRIKEGKAEKDVPGIPLDFDPPVRKVRGRDNKEEFVTPVTPLVVDFHGGRRKEPIADDAAVDLLLLNSDGQLIVRNSRIDAENKDRTDRYEHWRNRIDHLNGNGGGMQTPIRPKGNIPGIPGL